LLCNDREIGDYTIPKLFLGNGSVNMFLLLGSRFLIRKLLGYNSGRAVFYVAPAEML
jgi:hypothetical protein